MITYHLNVYIPEAVDFTGFESYREVTYNIADRTELDAIQELCENKTNMVGSLKWSFIPIRTNVLSDLLCPTLVNGALTCKDSQMFPVIALISLIWDAATLLIRLTTYIPRLAYNCYVKPKPHPLAEYLKEKGLELEQEDKRVNISLYEQREDQRAIEQTGNLFKLALSDKEMPFLTSRDQFRRGVYEQ